MHLSVYLPLLFSALFGLSAPALARRLPPAPATWLLSLGGLLAAAAPATSLALLGFTLVGQDPLLAERGHWSDAALRHADPVSTPIACAAIIALVAFTCRTVAAGARRLAAVRDAHQLAALFGAPGELVVIDDADPHAFAVPGRPARIVVSTGLLRRLDATQRRAVLAHERAHLIHRHHLHQTLAQVAAAGDPLLRRLPAAVALACERWADEDAAGTCRRETVAAALTRAAMRTRHLPRPAVVLGAAITDVASRVAALHAPAPRLRVWRVVLLLGMLAAALLAVLEAVHDTERLFELAQFAYRTAPARR